MLKKSELVAQRRPTPVEVPNLASPPVLAELPVDTEQLVEMQKAIGELAQSMGQMAWGMAAMVPAAPVTGMDVEVVRDGEGRMASLKVKVTR